MQSTMKLIKQAVNNLPNIGYYLKYVIEFNKSNIEELYTVQHCYMTLIIVRDYILIRRMWL